MTDDAATEVAGGLDAREDLQPDQGALRLAGPDDHWTRADWEKVAAAVLRKSRRLGEDDRDASVWERLARTTYDGIVVTPLGTPDLLDGLTTTGRPSRVGPWDVRTAVRGDAAAAVHDLENGATSLWLLTGDPATQLEGVRLDLAAVVLEAGTPSRARALLDLATERGTRLHPRSNLGADLVSGRVRGHVDGGEAAAVEVARLALEHGVRGLVVDGTTLHDLGASDAQEVGFSLAAGAAYLRLLADAGVGLEDAAKLLEFRYAATDEQFATIAKLRAARRCWARVLELSDASGEQAQHAVTSRPMTSAFDPWVNLLRGTVAAFAAGVAGAEAVTVVPFDSPLGAPDDFGRRIARNVSALLVAESHVAAVTDPAGGAYAVEKLTDDLATASWAELQRIEGSGGVLAALDDGSLLARVADTTDRRERDVATRRKPITGLSEFPHLAESLPTRDGEPDDVRRWGAAYEALRAEPAEAHVFLATLGPVAEHTSRAGFATNLLAAGGIAVDVAGATSGVEDLTSASDGQRVVCLAGTDAAYAEWGSAAAEALRDAGAKRVLVVSTSSTDAVRSTDELTWADDTFRPGDDAVAFLTRTREALR